jgi:hypothetical protein
MRAGEILETGAAALLFAAVFVAGGRVHPLRGLVRDRRTLISFGAGMSVAYVFVRAIPELQGVRRSFVASVSVPLRYEGMAIYFSRWLAFWCSTASIIYARACGTILPLMDKVDWPSDSTLAASPHTSG